MLQYGGTQTGQGLWSASHPRNDPDLYLNSATLGAGHQRRRPMPSFAMPLLIGDPGDVVLVNAGLASDDASYRQIFQCYQPPPTTYNPPRVHSLEDDVGGDGFLSVRCPRALRMDSQFNEDGEDVDFVETPEEAFQHEKAERMHPRIVGESAFRVPTALRASNMDRYRLLSEIEEGTLYRRDVEADPSRVPAVLLAGMRPSTTAAATSAIDPSRVDAAKSNSDGQEQQQQQRSLVESLARSEQFSRLISGYQRQRQAELQRLAKERDEALSRAERSRAEAERAQRAAWEAREAKEAQEAQARALRDRLREMESSSQDPRGSQQLRMPQPGVPGAPAGTSAGGSSSSSGADGVAGASWQKSSLGFPVSPGSAGSAGPHRPVDRENSSWHQEEPQSRQSRQTSSQPQNSSAAQGATHPLQSGPPPRLPGIRASEPGARGSSGPVPDPMQSTAPDVELERNVDDLSDGPHGFPPPGAGQLARSDSIEHIVPAEFADGRTSPLRQGSGSAGRGGLGGSGRRPGDSLLDRYEDSFEDEEDDGQEEPEGAEENEDVEYDIEVDIDGDGNGNGGGNADGDGDVPYGAYDNYDADDAYDDPRLHSGALEAPNSLPSTMRGPGRLGALSPSGDGGSGEVGDLSDHGEPGDHGELGASRDSPEDGPQSPEPVDMDDELPASRRSRGEPGISRISGTSGLSMLSDLDDFGIPERRNAPADRPAGKARPASAQRIPQPKSQAQPKPRAQGGRSRAAAGGAPHAEDEERPSRRKIDEDDYIRRITNGEDSSDEDIGDIMGTDFTKRGRSPLEIDSDPVSPAPASGRASATRPSTSRFIKGTRSPGESDGSDDDSYGDLNF